MADESTGSKGASAFEKAAGDKKNASLISDVLGFLGQNKKWWLLPILGTFLVIGVLVLLSSTAAAPFIYTLF